MGRLYKWNKIDSSLRLWLCLLLLLFINNGIVFLKEELNSLILQIILHHQIKLIFCYVYS